jgi:hypothetical protein
MRWLDGGKNLADQLIESASPEPGSTASNLIPIFDSLPTPRYTRQSNYLLLENLCFGDCSLNRYAGPVVSCLATRHRTVVFGCPETLLLNFLPECRSAHR